MTEWETELECSCCGRVAARADSQGFFHEDQPLICGCEGCVSLDNEERPWVNASECECER